MTEKEKEVVRKINHSLYTVEFLEEWKNRNDSVIVYILSDPEYCKPGYVILGLEPCAIRVHGELPELSKYERGLLVHER